MHLLGMKRGLLAVILVSVGFWGCKKDSPGTDVTVKFNFRYGPSPLSYGQEYPYADGQFIKIELVKFYVSLPALRNEAGEWVPFEEQYFLVDLENPVMHAGKFSEGVYTAMQLGIGVDNSRNVQTDPQAIPATDYPTDHPLNAAADMWWGWAAGYIFVKLEGRIDADGNGLYSDIEDKAVSYHPGVSELYRTVTVSRPFAVSGKNTQLELNLDVRRLIHNVDLLEHPAAHPMNPGHGDFPFARRMMDNFPDAIE